jgi:hypothetical protein
VPEDHPDYFKPLPELPKSHGQEQWDWIEAQLNASTADYIFVGGHYPVYSVCEQGRFHVLDGWFYLLKCHYALKKMLR